MGKKVGLSVPAPQVVGLGDVHADCSPLGSPVCSPLGSPTGSPRVPTPRTPLRRERLPMPLEVKTSRASTAPHLSAQAASSRRILQVAVLAVVCWLLRRRLFTR